MRNKKFTLPFLIVFLLLIILAFGAGRRLAAASTPQSTPIIPHQVFGLVRVNGAFVSEGTLISAWCGGVSYDQFAVYRYENQSWYKLEIPGDDTSTSVKEGCITGEVISFTIGFLDAEQIVVWRESGLDQIDLSASFQADNYIYLPLIMK